MQPSLCCIVFSWQGATNKNNDFPDGTSILSGIQQAVRAAVECTLKGIYSRYFSHRAPALG
jgi:hypothetical protein